MVNEKYLTANRTYKKEDFIPLDGYAKYLIRNQNAILRDGDKNASNDEGMLLLQLLLDQSLELHKLGLVVYNAFIGLSLGAGIMKGLELILTHK